MYSSADKVDGQGVGSAYEEQVALIKEGADDLFDVTINDWTTKPDIQHFHTIDPTFFVKMQDKKAVNIAYCHFLPETVDESLKIPSPFFKILRVFLHSSLVHCMYLPKRPSRSTMSWPHLSHLMTGPQAGLSLKSPCSRI